MYYEINEKSARQAHNLMSLREYVEGSVTADYRAAVDKATGIAEAQKKKVSEYYHRKIDTLLDRYARQLALYYNEESRIGCMCPSVMVSGGSNFPVQKKERQVKAWEKNRENLEKANHILSEIQSAGTGSIDFSDPNAREMLQERLDRVQDIHSEHLKANAYYRKHKTLDGCPGISEKDAEWLNRPGVFNCGENGTPLELNGQPFPAYELQGETAKIKRLKDRLKKYDDQHSMSADGRETAFDGGKIVRNVEQNRLQIVFEDKPDEDMRSSLKSNGFRWSPRNGAWQRQLTENAESVARVVLGI